MLHWLQPVWKIGISALLIALPLAGAPAANAARPGEPGPAAPAATQLYVDRDAPGPAHDGLTWTTAYTTVQDALDWTNAHGSVPFEIWVAEGVYYPDEGAGHVDNAVTETFTIAWNNVQLYGGFAATETLRTGRDWVAHPTVLSGDLEGNDLNADGNFVNEVYSDTVGSNAYHVLTLDGATNQPLTGTTAIDGFTITGGNANSGEEPHPHGGGLLCNGKESGHECSPTLANLHFSGNQAVGFGGGIYNDGRNGGSASPALTHVTFSGNLANLGGGLYNTALNGGTASPALTDVVFSGNAAYSGGGLYNYGYGGAASPALINVLFSGNQASSRGGGVYNNGSYSGTSDPTLVNVTLSGNRAGQYGGAMYNQANNGSSRPALTNSILWGNTAANGPQIYNNGNVTPTVTYSDIEGGHPGTGNLDNDPQFVAPISASGAPTTTGDYHLSEGSPAIDAGDTSSIVAATDLDGSPRIQGGAVDLGAYEAEGASTYWVYLPLVVRP